MLKEVFDSVWDDQAACYGDRLLYFVEKGGIDLQRTVEADG